VSKLKSLDLAPLQVAVLAGGDSAERSVSIESGAAVAAALTQRGHRVQLVDPAELNLRQVDWSDVDVAFLALHGTFGEDGGAQEVLETLDVVFTGSDSRASRLAFNKADAKTQFRLHDVPTPEARLIRLSDSPERLGVLAAEIGYPVVVKPNSQGSSIGVSIVRSESELLEAAANCFRFDHEGLCERAIFGTEWTLGIIDDVPLPLIQIGTDHGFFDFDAKYRDDSTIYDFAPEISEAVRQQLTETGLAASRALGCRGVSRVDMLFSDDGPTVLEVNTIPGMTDHSLVPKAAARIGLDMGQLCEVLLDRALKQRHITAARKSA
jgi:D-alanine-D-alanine ligase